MKEIKTITPEELKEFDLLFYRPSSFFGNSIVFYDALCYWYNPKALFRILTGLSFSHVATVLYSPITNKFRRYDSCEGFKTGYRSKLGPCYVFRMKLTAHDKVIIENHLLSRRNSTYDRKGIMSFLFPHLVQENEFMDYCSELVKNALLLTGHFMELSGVQLTPFSLYSRLRPRLTFVGLLLK